MIKLHHGDCLDVLRTMSDASVDAIVTDPPYGLRFMAKRWDYDVPTVEIWAECLRVLKPGGHLLAFAGTRTQHRMAVRIEDAGFEIRDMIAWVYGSGFPKSLDVSKAIDKQRHDRAEIYQVTAWIREARDNAGITNRDIDAAFEFSGMAGHWTSSKSQPAVPTLEQVPVLLEVLGVAFDDMPDEIRRLLWDLNGKKGQPGENWAKREVVGTKRSSLGGTVAAGERDLEFISKHRRLEFQVTAPATPAARQWQGWGTALKPAMEPITVARKPLDGTVAETVLAHGTGALNIDGCRVRDGSETGGEKPAYEANHGNAVHGAGMGGGAWENTDGRFPANLIHDGSDEVVELFPHTNGEGSAARFFYTAKADATDRNDGLLPDQRNKHPTVKPVDLMRYLCRLVTPPGGIVLDPFMGSGSTGKACVMEGFSFIGIERDADSFATAQARVVAPMPLFKEML